MTVNYFIWITVKKNHDQRIFNNSGTHKKTISKNPWNRQRSKIKTEDRELCSLSLGRYKNNLIPKGNITPNDHD